MTRPIHRSAGVALALGFAFASPAAAQAAAINLGTAASYSVLGGQSVTNTGTSVLNGSLGVAPGNSVTGFPPGLVTNGTIDRNNARAQQAQQDLGTAYTTAANEPSDADLTGQDLGGLTLTTGVYSFTSSAQLTGRLTLDAQGDPDARFVFRIGSTLTTASASSVQVINGGSACNVFWQVGSSATLGSATSFQGNIMALASITLRNAVSITGRALARTASVTLDNDTVNSSSCRTAPTPAPAPEPEPGPTPTPDPFPAPGSFPAPTPTPTSTPAPEPSPAPGSSEAAAPTPTQEPTPAAEPAPAPGPPAPDSGAAGSTDVAVRPVAAPPAGVPSFPPPASRSKLPTRNGIAKLQRRPRTPGAPEACRSGFNGAVRGSKIKSVVFRLDGRRIASKPGARFQVFVRALPGKHRITARVTFTDATRAKTMSLPYRVCAAAVLRPTPGPMVFTG